MLPLEEIEHLAVEAHARVNHFYGQMPYSYHIRKTAEVGKEFLKLMPHLFGAEDHDIIIGACYYHDTIEDTRKTYNDVRRETESTLLAEIVYAVSNEKGKTRHQRANKSYYIGIVEQYGAVFVKLCDRIANLRHGRENNSDMFAMYRKEHPHFIESVLPTEHLKQEYHVMKLEIETLLGLNDE